MVTPALAVAGYMLGMAVTSGLMVYHVPEPTEEQVTGLMVGCFVWPVILPILVGLAVAYRVQRRKEFTE